MMKHTQKLILLSLTIISCLTGCSFTRERNVASDTDAEKVENVESMNDLKNNHFYIYDSKTHLYRPVYMKNASFVSDPDQINTSVDDSRSLYFTSDWDYVPTLQNGDSLIYYIDDTFDGNFVLERFEDFGYSIGISNLEKFPDNRVFLDTRKDNDEFNPYINRGSEAEQLFELNSESIVIDKISGKELRQEDLTRGGSVELEKGQPYVIDAYKGSHLYRYTMHADTRILTSMDITLSVGYTFLESKIIRIDIPEYFNNGYYMINGQGIFKYVKDSSGDFKTPNEDPEAKDTTTTYVDDSEEDSISKEAEKFDLAESGRYDITVRITNLTEDNVTQDPVVKILGPECAYTLSKVGTNEFKLEDVKLKSGRYSLSIENFENAEYDLETHLRN